MSFPTAAKRPIGNPKSRIRLRERLMDSRSDLRSAGNDSRRADASFIAVEELLGPSCRNHPLGVTDVDGLHGPALEATSFRRTAAQREDGRGRSPRVPFSHSGEGTGMRVFSRFLRPLAPQDPPEQRLEKAEGAPSRSALQGHQLPLESRLLRPSRPAGSAIAAVEVVFSVCCGSTLTKTEVFVILEGHERLEPHRTARV
jgi:hypothetical protein